MTTTPPPSKALLELQRRGLELGTPSPTFSLRIPGSGTSAQSSSSDLDKPLPLEPSELGRRSSSVYSTDTTITNIIHMYGGFRDLDIDLDDRLEAAPLPRLHHPQAYRDTVAPLLARRLSLSRTPSPYSPWADRHQPKASASSLSLRSLAPPRVAPTLAEFSHRLQGRKNELASPAAGLLSDIHRQVALDQLSAPSAQVSSVELSIRVAQTPPLPDAMWGSVSDVTDDDLLPSPPDLRSSSPPSPVFSSSSQYDLLQPQRPTEGSPSELMEQRYKERHWSENWLVDEQVIDHLGQDVSRSGSRERGYSRQGSTEQAKERALSYATSYNSGLERGKWESGKSARQSLQEGVSDLLRSVSKSSRAWNGAGSVVAEEDMPREHQLGTPANAYQVPGEEMWSKKKKKPREERADPKRGKSLDLATAYHNGQSQLVDAMHRFTRRATMKRKKKLKQSIVMVGPMATMAPRSSRGGVAQQMHDDGKVEWI